MLAEPAVLIDGFFEAHLVGVVEGQGDVTDGHLVDVERHVRLLRGVFRRLGGFFLLGIFLEGIDQELIVGRALLRLVEAGFHSVEQHFLDFQLPADELPQIDIDQQATELQHLPMLLVFHLQTFENDFLGEHVDTGMVDFYARTYFIL